MGGPPTLSPERCDWGTGTIIGLRAVRGENRKRWVSVRPVRPSPRFRCTVVVPTACHRLETHLITKSQTRLDDDVSAAHESFARRPCRRHCSIRRPAVSSIVLCSTHESRGRRLRHATDLRKLRLLAVEPRHVNAALPGPFAQYLVAQLTH